MDAKKEMTIKINSDNFSGGHGSEEFYDRWCCIVVKI